MPGVPYHGFTWDEIGNEEWRLVPGFPNYEVSALGQVRNANTRNVLKPLRGPAGRPQVCLTGRARRFIHQLVCEAFWGPRPEGYTVDHLDGDRLNNRAENLEWCSRAENIQRHVDRMRVVIKNSPPRRARRDLSTDELVQELERERMGL